MAYDSARIVVADAALVEALGPATRPAPLADGFDRSERLAILLGGAGLGAMAGFGLAMGLGSLSLLTAALIAGPMLALALHLTSITLTEAIEHRSWGCACAATLHGAAVLAWPMTALLAPLSVVNFCMALAAAVSALIALASCWQGPSRAIYRLAVQAMLAGAAGAHQGLMLLLMGA